MAKQLHILLMVFCLGIFIFPKQNALPQKEEMSCCQKETTKDCCASKEAPKESKEQNHSCEGDCSQCGGCAVSIVLLIPSQVSFPLEKSSTYISQKVETPYLQPSLSAPNQAIWQPPKIS